LIDYQLKIFKGTMMRKILLIAITMFSYFICNPVNADQERHIHLNGEHLDGETMLMMDQVFGGQVNDGFYWLNQQTGEWGYEDNPAVQGVVNSVVQYQQQPAQQHAPSSSGSKRGEYSSSQNGSAYIGGEGECSYVSAGGMSFRSCD
jgi:hypothetical protein